MRLEGERDPRGDLLGGGQGGARRGQSAGPAATQQTPRCGSTSLHSFFISLGDSLCSPTGTRSAAFNLLFRALLSVMLFAAEWKSGTPPWVLCADTHAFYFSYYHTKSNKVTFFFLLKVCALSLFSLNFFCIAWCRDAISVSAQLVRLARMSNLGR